jgi:sulfur carrier protein
MRIILNGAVTEVADHLTMAELLAQLRLADRRLAVEVNAELVPRSRFEEHRLAPQDRVEIIHAVGGG